ncbi:P-loop containing nucleoside triphosphate hydrolase protein [Mariannaea sp. PMI_226]|nr:P-loop containing nucleoside triphosphate hydrolase protein [Mariannaea sp. PMI_226]
MKPISVFARWRPLPNPEAELGEIDRKALPNSRDLFSITMKRHTLTDDYQWASPAAFSTVFNPEHHNSQVYQTVVAPNISKVLRGENCSVFAYGHSGSGKTHTVVGYEFEDSQELGLCLAAAKDLFSALQHINKDEPGQALGIGFSLFELRKKSAYDLLNNHAQCHVRQGPDGKVHVRGETEMLEEGKVRVCPIVQQQCWTFESFKRELVEALEQRATGTSTIHDQSSRTHAILELEIVNQPLVDARQALFNRQSELVPVGKRAIDIMIEEDTKGIIPTPDGGWEPNPDYQKDQERIDAAEAEKAEFEARVAAAERRIEEIITSRASLSLGTKMVFVDLAGAEYYEGNGPRLRTINQTPQERQEGRQINTDLLALKEVMRAWSQNDKRIPFRSSTLTMVLREHFMNTEQGNSAIIVTLSSAADQYAATLNSLKYASLIGAAS